MKKDLLKIIEHFGIRNQLKKFNEENYELIEAIMDMQYSGWEMDYPGYNKAKKEYTNHIIEEIADVCVILRQFMEIYNISQDEISERMANKINRTLERIESGYYEKPDKID